jgi:3-phosphoshikimate 1-carboxyvinyltransferase
MSTLNIKPIKTLKGRINIPGDKSISHRAIILGSLGEGDTIIENFLKSTDCLNTLEALKSMGVSAEFKEGRLYLQGRGLRGFKEPKDIIDLGNSGTSMRLLTGLLSALDFFVVLTGDESLKNRPMKRVIEPLSIMGAMIYGREENNYPPLAIIGNPKLKGICYKSPIASAQVKSAILLAGLYAEGSTSYTEPLPTRDHTERMLSYMGAEIEKRGLNITIKKTSCLKPPEILNIPGDISSASFFIVLAVLLEDSYLFIPNIGLNPNRIGIIEILKEMGGRIEILNQREECGEMVGDIEVRGGRKLKGVNLDYKIIPKIIDEIPIIALACCFAKGTTKITGASELRVKESDRIKNLVSELRRLKAKIKELPDGMIIEGENILEGGEVNSHQDHRLAMTLIIAGLVAQGETKIEDIDCIKTSFPNFTDLLFNLIYN